MAFGRNLTASEILDQVLHFRRSDPVNHLVFMGMGEPFMNVDAVLEAARRLPDIGITHRRTTISTVGWIPGLARFVDEVSEPIRLALSLHAADPGSRSELMPVNDRYPLPDVLALCRAHWERTRRRVFVEYVMLAGVNDAPAQARQLAEFLGRDAFKVNLIPYNPTGMSRGLVVGPRSRRSRRRSTSARPGHRSAYPRPRHRGGLRATRRSHEAAEACHAGGMNRAPDAEVRAATNQGGIRPCTAFAAPRRACSLRASRSRSPSPAPQSPPRSRSRPGASVRHS